MFASIWLSHYREDVLTHNEDGRQQQTQSSLLLLMTIMSFYHLKLRKCIG